MENRQVRIQSNRNMNLKDMGFLEITKLERNIDQIYRKNKSKYQQIVLSQSTFMIELYCPNQKFRQQKLFKKELLIKQLDKLMDQEAILDKKIAQIKFIKEQEKIEIQENLNKHINPYTLLRNVWAQHKNNNGNEYKDNFQRIESLNFTIGKIKNTILTMKIKEQQIIKSTKEQFNTQNQNHKNKVEQDQAQKSNPCAQQSMKSINEKYQILLTQYQASQMKIQQLICIAANLQQKLVFKQNQIISQKNKFIQLQKQNKVLLKQKEIQQINKKITLAESKQQIYDTKKKLDKLEKWKNGMDKNMLENMQQNFKVYFQWNTNIISSISDYFDNNRTITKKIDQILTFLKSGPSDSIQQKSQQILNNPQFLQIGNEQNNDLNSLTIPTLNFSQSNKNLSMRKKMSTDRPLKNRNIQATTYIKKLDDLKYTKLSSSINQQSMKKFIRKNPGLATTRKLEPQYSQRSFIQAETQSSLNI